MLWMVAHTSITAVTYLPAFTTFVLLCHKNFVHTESQNSDIASLSRQLQSMFPQLQRPPLHSALVCR